MLHYQNLKGYSFLPYEYRFMRKDGDVIWVLENVTSTEYKGKPATLGSFMDITEQKQVEEVLRESQGRYRALFESFPDAIAQVDSEGEFLAVNPVMANSFSLSVKELIGRKLSDVVPEAIAQYRLKIMGKALDEGQIQVFEDERAGRYFHSIVTPVKIPGQKEATQVISRDITQLKQAERALRESEAKYSAIVNGGNDGIVIVKDLKFIFANQRVADLTGYTVEEIQELEVEKVVDLEYLGMAWERYNRRMAGEDVPAAYDIELIHKDGQRIPVEIDNAWIEYQGGPADVIFIRDITERKRMETELKQSEEQFHTLFEISPDPILIIDIGGMLIDVNAAFSEKTKYTREEVVGVSATNLPFIKKEDLVEALNNMAQRLAGKEIPAYSLEIIPKEGEHIFAEIAGNPITREGKLVGEVIIARDITERKQAQEKLERLNRVLSAIRNVNQLISREKDRDRLLKGICDNLIETRGYYNAWIVLLDGSGKFVKYAEAGLGKKFQSMAERLKSGELTDCGRRALTQSGAVVVNNPTSTCTGCPLAKEYEDRGAMTTRLEYDGKVYGLLSASMTADFITEMEERALFKEIAGDVALALRGIDLEEERERGEEALRESEELYRLLAENVTDFIWTVDTSLKFTYVSPSVTHLLGYTVEEVMSATIKDLLTPASFQNAMKIFAEEMAVEQQEQKDLFRSPKVELEHIRKDGSMIWTEISVTFLHDADGKFAGILGVTRDVTERKQAEEELQESQAKYSALVEQTKDGVMVVQDGLCKFANKALAEITGYPVDEAVGMSFLKMVVPEDRKLVIQRYESSMAGKEVSPFFETRIRCKDGTIKEVEVLTEVIQYEGRSAELATVRDITERKRMEEALRESESIFQTLFDTMSEGVILITRRAEFHGLCPWVNVAVAI